MSAIVIWRPEPMTARLQAAAAAARTKWATLARARCSNKAVASSIHVLGDRVAATHPLAGIVEHGAKPHVIEAKNKVLKMANGGYATVVHHPGSPAEPYLAPTLPAWVPLYRQSAAGAIRGL